MELDLDFKELLQVTRRDSIDFFYKGLKEVTYPERKPETLYVAFCLATNAETSNPSDESSRSLSPLTQVLDEYVLCTRPLTDPDRLENAAAQILFYAGFFRGQMSRRHGVKWFDEQGANLYYLAQRNSEVREKRKIFSTMSRNFDFWTQTCWSLSRHYQEERLLLKLRS